MIKRDPKYYITGYDGDDPYKAPFYLRALVFDSAQGDFNTALVSEFNEYLTSNSIFPEEHLEKEEIEIVPRRVLIINASHDDLPTSYETARIFDDYCKEKGFSVVIKVINSSHELEEETSIDPEYTLIVSQCVDKNVYNAVKAVELEEKGIVIVPGQTTAPGGVFSDKDSTYRLLSEEGRDWSEVARYIKVQTDRRSVEEVVDGIFEAITKLNAEIGDTTFFVKPHEGGGGLGGFRITKAEDGYIIPDLSKVSGQKKEIHPTFIDFDLTDEDKLLELLWIYRLFASDEKMKKNYLKVSLSVLGVSDQEGINILKEYLTSTEEKREKKLKAMILSPEKAKEELTRAIDIFEKKFTRRYVPLVNEHIDFGLWGLRAHYRLSQKGPVLETIYHRIFQLGFTEEGLGYMGSDNISNKQTGDLEITRLGPVNKIMFNAIGGREKLFQTLQKGARALSILSKSVGADQKNKVPLRLQLDLAALSQRIGEGNADTARGLCLASRWTEFVRNAREWFEDSLGYYSWKKK